MVLGLSKMTETLEGNREPLFHFVSVERKGKHEKIACCDCKGVQLGGVRGQRKEQPFSWKSKKKKVEGGLE